MTKDSFYQDDADRTQRLRTQTRRRGRWKRKRTLAIIFVALVALLIVAAPSIVCQSPLAKSLFSSTLAKYGFDGSIDAIRVGWMTPLRIDGLQLKGRAAGSSASIDLVQTNLTILRLVRGPADLGEIEIRGVVVDVSVSDGSTSVEDDIASLLSGDASETTDASAEPSAPMTAKISTKNVSVRVTDVVTSAQWIADQSKADIELTSEKFDITFSTVLTDPNGGSGEMEGRIQYPLLADKPYQLNLVTQRIPLSLATLAKRRLGESGASIPRDIGGDTTGSVTVSGGVDNVIHVSAAPMEFRNFVASDPSLGDRVWRNGLTAISGSVTLGGDRIIGRELQLTTDFGRASFNGSFKSDISLAGQSNPAAWLEALDGAAGMELDVVALERAMPGLIPLRDQVEITAGSISADVTTTVEAGAVRRSYWNLKTQPIRAIASGRTIVIEPATVVASLQVADGQLSADSLRIQSVFANASADGDLSRGRIKGDVQFDRLAALIQPLVEMPELTLAGQATGEVNWAAQPNQTWRLDGKAEAQSLAVTLPGIDIRQPSMRCGIGASGQWSDQALRRLDVLDIQLSTADIEATASLVEAVENPTASTLLPLKIASRGRLESLAAILGSWMPSSMLGTSGGYVVNALARVSSTSGDVTLAKLQLDKPQINYAGTWYTQPQVMVDFDGRYAWPESTLDAQKLSIVSDALSAAIQGRMDGSGTKFDIAWRAKLERLQSAMGTSPSIANASSPLPNNGASTDARPVAFRNSPPETVSYLLIGDCEGRMSIAQDAASTILKIDSTMAGNDIKIARPTSATPTASKPGAQTATSTPLWSERLVNLDTQFTYDLADGQISAEKIKLATDWIASILAGKIRWDNTLGDVVLRGTTKIKMPDVATQLSSMLGMTVRLQGVHETPIDIVAKRVGDAPMSLAVDANVGWDSGEFAGIKFGATTIPVTMNETIVSIKPATIPVEQGRLTLAGDLVYSPGPMFITMRPGVVAEDLNLTPELTNQWLQYVAPMVANSTRVEGTFGVELAEAKINLENTLASRVRGSLRIKNVNLDSGPIANQVIGSIRQMKQIARGLNADTTAQQDLRLVTFPTQSVDFDFADGVVSHQRMMMEIDRAKILTGGQVNVDGRINLVTQVPLDPSWLGSDLKALAGQTITLPITGTLSRPTLDAAAIRRMVTEMGTKAIQSNAENFIEKQLGRGFDKLLGR